MVARVLDHELRTSDAETLDRVHLGRGEAGQGGSRQAQERRGVLASPRRGRARQRVRVRRETDPLAALVPVADHLVREPDAEEIGGREHAVLSTGDALQLSSHLMDVHVTKCGEGMRH
jgi:hypothetical protein